MTQKSTLIIGAGIAGLAAGCYGQMKAPTGTPKICPRRVQGKAN